MYLDEQKKYMTIAIQNGIKNRSYKTVRGYAFSFTGNAEVTLNNEHINFKGFGTKGDAYDIRQQGYVLMTLQNGDNVKLNGLSLDF